MALNLTNTINVSEETVTVKLGTTGLKGRPGIVFREDWIGTSTYYVGDVVRYQGSLWINTNYTTANATNYPTVSSDWDIFTEKGEKGDPSMTVSTTEPLGHCSLSSYGDETLCLANGENWTATKDGDMWFDTATGRLFARVSDDDGDAVWFDISGVVGSMDASDIVVGTSGNLAGGTLQDILEKLENDIYNSASTPVDDVQEGNIWYDLSDDSMKVYRNGVWEVIVHTGSTEDGYDNISLNGGNF